MRVLAATLTLLVSSAAPAQECKTCSMADACMKTYLKAASEAQKATKEAIRDWKQNLDRKASAEFSSRGTAALQTAMESQVRLELERLKECLAKTLQTCSSIFERSIARKSLTDGNHTEHPFKKVPKQFQERLPNSIRFLRCLRLESGT